MRPGVAAVMELMGQPDSAWWRWCSMRAAEVASVAGAELAATQEPGGPRGPVDASWLILQRLSDLKEQMADLRRAQDELRSDVKALDDKIESVRRDSLGLWRWSLALPLVPILGLMAKLLIPSG
jgi:hypothetical protein